ncbi:hypothetical protein [Staphylococcus sp. GDY8P57P]|uniref:hypothetical protein n=1 Tax=Staphylococcus sp. GDY8P57P TaxID=2804128 RepID=UPI001881054F|nr:hypothetical protein [Staphylococcus sp. GDY8P57P]MBF2757418.1 hypothetical protein [Staphylococcus haemolyticus]MBF2774118.1 hypothetical protein [Staphylococcus haemolyticus]MBF2776084.1 hypothetical protein [Staphylococcus haemolyticus]MBF2815719.1 hypothetical protein [Staphylococcus haemolyticus]MBF9719560.1 hypothetical protein [Staphylococcus haemolyticus]
MSERKTIQYDDRPPIHNQYYPRSHRYNQKRRSWVSLMIQMIIFVLVAITGYSMYKQPIFNLAFANQPISYAQIKDFQNTVTQIGALNINLSQLTNLEDIANRLVLVFNVFFILAIISLIISALTIIFNRTLLKLFNFIIISIMLIMSIYFGYAIQVIGQRIADKLQSFSLNVSANQIINEADAIHNALILLVCSLALLIISFFFRNRKTNQYTIK